MCPIVSSNWNNGSNAGVWTLNLNNYRTNSNYNVSVRADSAKPRNLIVGYGGAKGDTFQCVVNSAAKSVYYCLSGSNKLIDILISCERQAI